jgi:cytochrome c oxidase subunit 2
MRRGSILSLVGIGVIAGAIAAAVALFLPWLPSPASREAGRIDFLFWFVIVICIVIFAIVAAVLAYEIVRFRVAPDDETDGPPIHGNTSLEIAWTLIPTLLVTAIGIVSAVVLAQNDAQGKDVLHIDVTAQQFEWNFSYPDSGGFSSPILHLPKGRSILLVMHSKDVIHSFWVPQFSQKEDVVPGLTTTLHITPDKVGTFPVICTELCGLGHALMRSEAIVMEPAAFESWAKQQQKTTQPSASGGATNAAGKTVFANNGCGACHTLTAAGASATIGPDLDKLRQYASQAGQPLEPFIHQSIVDPNAYIQPGYPKNVMPPNFGTSISKVQLNALVQFLVSSSKKG